MIKKPRTRGGYNPTRGLQNTNPQWVVASVEKKKQFFLGCISHLRQGGKPEINFLSVIETKKILIFTSRRNANFVADFKCCVFFNGENSFDNGQTATTISYSVSLTEELSTVGIICSALILRLASW